MTKVSERDNINIVNTTRQFSFYDAVLASCASVADP